METKKIETNTPIGSKTNFKRFRISSALFQTLTKDEEEQLYLKLKRTMKGIHAHAYIEQQWQVDILLGRKIPTPQEVETLKDTMEATPLFYLALSGNIDALLAFLKEHPKQLYALTTHKDTIVHYIAWSENMDGLFAFLEKYPKQLNSINKKGWGIANFVALSNNANDLVTFFKAYKSELGKHDMSGETVAHFLSKKNYIKTLKSFLEAYPDEAKATDGYLAWSCAIYAAVYDNPEALAVVWPFIGDVNRAAFYKIIEKIDKNKPLKTITTALQESYRLNITADTYTYLLGKDLFKSITPLYERNQSRGKDIIAFKVFMAGVSQDTSLSRIFPLGVLKTILDFLLSCDYPNDKEVATKCINDMRPTVRADFLISSHIKALNGFSFNSVFSKEKTQGKISTLEALKNLVNSPEPLALASFTKWYQNNETTINDERTPFKSTLQSSHITKTRLLITDICRIFNFDEKVVTEKPEDTLKISG